MITHDGTKFNSEDFLELVKKNPEDKQSGYYVIHLDDEEQEEVEHTTD